MKALWSHELLSQRVGVDMHRRRPVKRHLAREQSLCDVLAERAVRFELLLRKKLIVARFLWERGTAVSIIDDRRRLVAGHRRLHVHEMTDLAAAIINGGGGPVLAGQRRRRRAGLQRPIADVHRNMGARSELG